jgi:hypothetical protein
MPSPNIELLTQIAKRLGPLLQEVVFVGGCTTGLFLTDEAAGEVRPTFDVDAIAESPPTQNMSLSPSVCGRKVFEKIRAKGHRYAGG